VLPPQLLLPPLLPRVSRFLAFESIGETVAEELRRFFVARTTGGNRSLTPRCAPATHAHPMLENYFPILLQVLIAGGFAGVTLLISVLLGKSAPRNEVKDSAYECGMLPIGDAQPRFSVKFYIVAMLFVLFDIEVVFLYPWSVIYKDYLMQHGGSILASMLGFVGILSVAFAYAWKKGALTWNK
jgi:NADH-quinone oxidoreductase subunit A